MKTEEQMKLVATAGGYNYWTAKNRQGKFYYNIAPEEQPAPSGGYFNADYICRAKHLPNLF